ncbi:AAA family ATPase [Gordonia sp. PDNC005]|uniref:AAA family ATPase n=1 Tax=Gordonia sp. PDNC005 TaxID=2811424 RepID=UPI00196693B6|nr:AAA family ATPase [Gordonia sp. PDNC005]QRY63415.1 AAA family ATPase [Gordonia sp. PDNC005]
MGILERRRARTQWMDGVQALNSGNTRLASDKFSAAVSDDPGMADAWLGLHATGQRQEEALIAMSANFDRYSEERQRTGIPLQSRFHLDTHITYRLRSHSELGCAVAAGHLDRREFATAAQVIDTLDQSDDPTWYLHGRHAFHTNDSDRAIRAFRVLAGKDKFLEAGSRLYSGALLIEAGVLGPAKAHLDVLLKQNFAPELHAEAAFFRGMAARAEENETQAQRFFEFAYARNPSLPGLKDAMQASVTPVAVTLNRPEPVDSEPARATPVEDPLETVDEILADLDRQVGQHAIKQQARMVVAQARAELARREAGLPGQRLTGHFVFSGPPGTGKTTVARIFARLYKALGILDDGHVVEVDRSGLIGKYHGHTVAQTKAKLDEAIGGVLFIDEAYALSGTGFTDGDPFGQEAINTLLKRMDDDRDQLIVIAAGYPEPMQQFLETNPGLRSRFTTTVNFAPYSWRELAQIADVMAAASGNRLDDAARAALGARLELMAMTGDLAAPSFGNGRFIRNVVEEANRRRDLRLFSAPGPATHDRQTLATITSADIEAAFAVAPRG